MFHRRSPSDTRSYRFDTGHRSHTGLKTVQHEIYRTWEIMIEHCTLGLTIRREQFSVRITDTLAQRDEYLKGFPSRVTAMQAARRRIDFIRDIRDPRAPRRKAKREARHSRRQRS